MSDCLFCRIVAGEVPAKVVHQDDEVVAFRDIDPKAPTHVLLVPRRHIPSLRETADADAALLGRMIMIARDLAVREGIDGSGYRVVINSGPQAGQSVFHVHVHLLGGRAMAWPPG